MGRLAFVTGATGFIGRNLVEQLATSGWRIRALVRPTSDTRHLREVGAELVAGDLSDVGALRVGVSSADVVFHLAAVTAARSAREYERANADGTRAIVRALGETSARPARLIYLSSYAACGPAVGGRPRTLTETPAPLTAYGRTKLAGETLAREAEAVGVGVAVIRAPVVYGPGDRALLPYFRLVRWRFAPVPAGGDRKLHLVFAPDLAAAVRKAADIRGGTYTVAEPVEHRWDDVIGAIAAGQDRSPARLRLSPRFVRTAAAAAETIGKLGGIAVAFNREKAEEMLAGDWICDLSGSEELLPRAAVTPLREGVERTTRWYIRQGWL